VLDCTYSICRARGKNRALNMGVRQAKYDWLVFFDDDVLPVPRFFLALKEGILQWGNAAAFGGRVIAKFPKEEGEIDNAILERVRAFAYSEFARPTCVDVLNAGESLMEGNMVIRKADLAEEGNFDVALGPADGAYRMGTHGTIFRRFGERSRPVVYLHEAVVFHIVRPEQLTYEWLLRRCFSFGRSLGYLQYKAFGVDGSQAWIKLVPPWIMRKLRVVVFRVKRKEFPMRMAQLEERVFAGALRERSRETAPVSRIAGWISAQVRD